MDQVSEYDATVKRSTLIIATISSFMPPFMGSSINIALPSIEKQFQVDAILLTWIATSYLVASAIALVPFGRLGDIYGRKKIFTWGIVIFTVFSFLSALSMSVGMLIFFRIFQGIGSSMIFSTGFAIITSVFPPWERGKAFGITVAAVYTGLSLGPVLGGFLTQHFTWRSIFLLNIPFGILSIYLIISNLKGEWAEARGEKFDIPGTLIYAFALTGLMYGITIMPSSMGFWITFLGILGIFAFVSWEIKIPYPVFQMSLFSSNRVFAFSGLAALINYSATFAVTFLMSLYLQHIKGLSPQGAGFILIAQPVVMALFSPLAGRLSDRIEPRIVASLGMAITTVGLASLVFLDKDSTLPFIVSCLILLGFGFAFFSSPNTNAIMGSVEKKFYGIASGAVGTMRLLGMMVSMGIATLIFAVLIGRVQISVENYPELLKSLNLAFAFFSLLCFGGVFASLVRGRLRV